MTAPGGERRYEVRGDRPAWGTTETSGRIAADDVAAEARRMQDAGCVDIVVVDHATGAITPYAPGWRGD